MTLIQKVGLIIFIVFFIVALGVAGHYDYQTMMMYQ